MHRDVAAAAAANDSNDVGYNNDYDLITRRYCLRMMLMLPSLCCCTLFDNCSLVLWLMSSGSDVDLKGNKKKEQNLWTIQMLQIGKTSHN